jgi:alpha-mannosidase
MRPQQEEKDLASALITWVAPSGDRVTAYRLPLHYSNHQHSIGQKLKLLPDLDIFRPERPWMIFFGVGNHGGGPTIEQLQEIEGLMKERDDLSLSDPEQFFASVDVGSLPVVRGEMQRHAIGCYSAHSEIKRLNRHAEHALTLSERIDVLAGLVGSASRASDFERAWKNICFNQFHDLLGGVAIHEASEDAISMYREAISVARRSTMLDIQRIASRIDSSASIENLIVFNPSAFEREEIIEFELWHPQASERGEILHSIALVDGDGRKFTTQKVEPSGKIGEDRVRFLAKMRVPALGWTSFGIVRHSRVLARQLVVSKSLLANGIIALGISTEEVADLHYSEAAVFKDASDTWAHGVSSFEEMLQPFEIESVEVIEDGPLRGGLRVESSAYSSRMEEEFFLSADGNHIEARIVLDWREQHKLLKLRYRHGCKSPVARYEIPYASMERPVGPEEWPGQSWVDVSESDGSRGLAIITDSKYSYSVDEKYIYIIAARSPLAAHHVPPHEVHPHERLRYLDQGVQEFRLFLVPHVADWRSANLPKLSEELHNPLIVHAESRHEGDLAKSYSAFELTGEGIQIGAIKKAEEGDGIILRAVETLGGTPQASFRFASMGVHWDSQFSPFEIKTFLISNGAAMETDLLERPL